MPIKFSDLTLKPIADSTKIVGLYADNTSSTGVSNCIINVSDFAKQSTLTEINNGAVHLYGVETITGAKTFSANNTFSGVNTFSSKVQFSNSSDGFQSIVGNSNSLSIGTHPSVNTGLQFYVKDKDNDVLNNRIGGLFIYYSTDGMCASEIRAYKPDKTIATNAKISVYYPESGTPYTSAPTPSSATDNSTKIATTAHLINVLKLIYPVGSVYIGTQNTCPMSSFFGTWTLVSSGKALWTGTGSNGNTTIAAGLPNITGTMDLRGQDGAPLTTDASAGGAFARPTGVQRRHVLKDTDGNKDNGLNGNWTFDASRSNSIYGASSTVQPPAYVVNVWRRTA